MKPANHPIPPPIPIIPIAPINPIFDGGALGGIGVRWGGGTGMGIWGGGNGWYGGPKKLGVKYLKSAGGEKKRNLASRRRGLSSS